MNLDKLINSRKGENNITFPISDAELCERYEAVTTPMVNDVLREMELLYQTLPYNIAPLKDDMKVAGIAFTIKGSKNLDIQDEMIQRAQMLEAIPECSVIAAGAPLLTAVYGIPTACLSKTFRCFASFVRQTE